MTSHVRTTMEQARISFFQSTGTAYVQASIQNACGWSNWSAPIPIQVNAGYFMIAPNPATNAITIAAKEKEKAKQIGDISEIKIYDNIGNLKKQSKYALGTNQVEINVTDLKPGIYYIEI